MIAHDIQKNKVHVAAIEMANDIQNLMLFQSKNKDLLLCTMWIPMDMQLNIYFGLLHVSDTTALCLKLAIEAPFSKHNLSMSRIGG